MSKPMEGPRTPDVLTNREAGGLILAFMAAVILVLTVATSMTPMPENPSTSSREPTAHTTESG
jgi:hypothetical protein